MSKDKSSKSRPLAFGSIFLLVTSFLIPISAPAVLAQATTGSIKGVVTDSAGAVIPDAEVTATDTATGAEAKGRTNAEGLYVFPKLKPGNYTVSVQKQGYKREQLQMVQVSLGQDVSLDTQLQAGNVTETVTITASGEELVQRQEVQISSTFETRQVADLPSNAAGGGIDTLALLAPGVVPGFGNVNNNGTTLSVNGNRARSNNFTIDGGDNNDLSIGGPSFFVDNQDTVAEFQVVTSNFSAEYGRNQGAIVNIVTKSGTNTYHGTGGWFHRDNSFLNSLNNLERRSGQTSPSADLFNVYEGTFGGPIKKDKLFFFGSFQEITDRSTFIARSGSPTIAPSSLAALSALSTSPAIQALAHLSAFALTDFGSVSIRPDKPLGTIVIGGQTFNTAYPQRAFPTPSNEPEFSARADYKITDKHSLWFRQFYQRATFTNNLGGSNGFTGNVPESGRLSTANFTSQLSNTLVNEFRFVYNRLGVIFGGGCTGVKGCIQDPSSESSFLNSFTNIAYTSLRDSSGVSLQTIGGATNLPQGRIVIDYQFTDNVSKTWGKHQLKFGADFHRLTNSVPFLPNALGAYRFSTSTSLTTNSPTLTTIAAGQLTIDYNETDQFYYVQDDFRIKDNITLNLGMRYENEGQPVNTLHDISVARESNAATAIWRQSLPLSARTFPKIAADNNNFAPRLGFAWSPHFDGKFAKMILGEHDKSVISAGYSIAYDPGFYNIMLNVSTSSPLVFNNTVPFALPANPTGANVQALAKSLGVIRTNTFNPAFFNQTVVQNDFRNPYSEQWTLRWQREISRNTVFELRYVGNHGVGLFQTVNANPRFDRLLNGFTAGGITFPGFPGLVPTGLKPLVCVDNPATPDNEGACNGRLQNASLIRDRNNTAQSSYHGLQTRLQTRLANQFSLGISYAFAKALDNSSEIFEFFETAYPQDPFSAKNERGYSGYDRRHAMSMNFIWDVPLGKGRNGFVGKALSGWQLNGTYFLASGQRYTPTEEFQSGFLGTGYEDTTFAATFFGTDAARPFLGNPNAPNSSVAISQVDAHLVFGAPIANSKGFYSFNALNGTGKLVTVTPADVRYIINGPGAATIFGTPFGNAQRGSLIGPRLNNMNLGVFKNIKVSERLNFQMRLEAFNALNHPNPGVGVVAAGSTPDRFLEDAGVQDGFNDKGGIQYARRVVQIGLKLLF